MRSSILDKVLAAFLFSLVVSSAVTAVVETRLTRTALEVPARRLAESSLRILESAYAERERTLVGDLRRAAQSPQAEGLADRARSREVVEQLGRTLRTLEIDLLELLDTSGSESVTVAGVGGRLARPLAPLRGGVSPVSRLMATAEGPVVQAVMVPVGPPTANLVLVGGYEFSDALAYRLRTHVGDVDHVVLVANWEVAGSTLSHLPSGAVPPGVSARELPGSPVHTGTGDKRHLVHYAPLGGAGGPQDRAFVGAVGVALPDPVGPLGRTLARNRLVFTALLALVALGLGALFFRTLTRPLVRLAGTAHRIAKGDLSARFDVQGEDEIGRLASSLDQMRRELRSQWGLIVSQAEELRRGSQRIVAAQDEERRRIARDLHDGIQQQLVLLRMEVGMSKETVPASSATMSSPMRQVGEQLDQVIERLRQVSHDLYPSILVDRGLTAALHSLASRLPLSTSMSTDPDPLPRLPVEVESGAYFLAGEAVTNVLKHAAATQLTLSVHLEDGSLVLVVSDDGVGFEPSQERASGGVVYMADRARSLGGTMTMTSRPGEGTTVTVWVPVKAVPATPGSAGGTTGPRPPGG